ncbi:MAG: HEAT repeat domain-containing protein, partial [Candidatus Jordarchaeales archaeon]
EVPGKLVELLSSEDEPTRGHAALTLASYAEKGVISPEAPKKLRELLHDESKWVRECAAQALTKYIERGVS